MKKALALIACSATLLLAGCGGGDTTAASLPDTAEGLWSGDLTINGTSANKFHALVTPDGALWMVYTNLGGGLVGVLQGDGVSDQTHHTFSSTSVTDRTQNGAYLGSLTGSYTAQSKFSAVAPISDGNSRILQINPDTNSVDYNSQYAWGLYGGGNISKTGRALTAGGLYDMTLMIDTAHGTVMGQIDPNGAACTYTGTFNVPTSNAYALITLSFPEPAVTQCSDRGLMGSVPGVFFLDPSAKSIVVTKDSTLAFLESPSS